MTNHKLDLFLLTYWVYWTEKTEPVFWLFDFTHGWWTEMILDLQVGVIATPDVHSFDLTGREQFIILGCDGLWGVCLSVSAFNLWNSFHFLTYKISLKHAHCEKESFQVFGPSDAIEFVHNLLKVHHNLPFTFDQKIKRNQLLLSKTWFLSEICS